MAKFDNGFASNDSMYFSFDKDDNDLINLDLDWICDDLYSLEADRDYHAWARSQS